MTEAATREGPKEEPIVVTRGLSKTYAVADKAPGLGGAVRHLVARKMRRVNAVVEADLEIAPGEMVGFLGPNGAGKTTMLKMLTGLVHPSEGEARVAGCEPFRREAAFLRRITLVMGNKQQLIWDLPAHETLRIHAAVYEIDDAEAGRRIGSLAEMLEVQDKLQQPVRKLSLGERMKVELLAALLHRPDVLFLDEPTLGLDVNAQATIRRFLKQYNEEHQATVLLTSHYMADITALCRRVVLIDKGRLMYDGDLAALLEQHTPFRQVTVETAGDVDEGSVPDVGEGLEIDGRRICLRVARDELPAALARLLSALEVIDLAVTDPPVEEIIGDLFRGGGRGKGRGEGREEGAEELQERPSPAEEPPPS